MFDIRLTNGYDQNIKDQVFVDFEVGNFIASFKWQC